MKKTRFTKLLSAAFCIVLIAAMALCITACNDNSNPDTVSSASVDTIPKAEPTSIGQGDTTFDFTVMDKDGKKTEFKVSTDKTTVGEALLEVGLIKGDIEQYGLYVKTVNGTTLDYDTDGMYWAFYVNGQYAMSGVDATEIKEGETYTFKAEK